MGKGNFCLELGIVVKSIGGCLRWWLGMGKIVRWFSGMIDVGRSGV